MDYLVSWLELLRRPDRDADAAIHVELGLASKAIGGRTMRKGKWVDAPYYTESIDASLPGEDIISVSEQKQQPGIPAIWVAVHRMPPGQMTIAARGYTEAIARRAAALKARGLSSGEPT